MAIIHKKLGDLKHFKGIFYDTNIWIYLYGIYPGEKYNENVSKVHKQILDYGNNIYYNNLVISEFINRNIHFALKEYNLSKGTDIKIKDFRHTPEFAKDFGDIGRIVKDEIIRNSKYLNKNWENDHFVDALDLMKNGYIDINDVFIMNECISKNILLFTLDRDLKEYPLNYLNILTC